VRYDDSLGYWQDPVSTKFTSPEAVERAFYQAIENADIRLLGDVWAREDGVVCIHPGCGRIEGRRAVLESFADLFVDAPAIHFAISDVVHAGHGPVAIHTVREEVQLDGQVISSMVATNIFQRNDAGEWSMVLHHSSHEPDMHVDDYFDDIDFDDFDDDHEVPPVLH